MCIFFYSALPFSSNNSEYYYCSVLIIIKTTSSVALGLLMSAKFSDFAITFYLFKSVQLFQILLSIYIYIYYIYIYIYIYLFCFFKHKTFLFYILYKFFL